MNPLLDFSGLPRFSQIEPQQIAPAVDALLAENRVLVEKLVADPAGPSWNNFVEPLEDANERLSRAWGPVAHLNSVMNSPELREAYNANLPKITQYHSELAQHQGLFEKYQALKTSNGFPQLSRVQQKVVENELRDFRLGGAELPAEKKARFMQIQEELARLYSRFEENLLDATNDFALYVTNREELAGLPEDMLDAAKEADAQDSKPGWKLTLHAPSWIPVMQYADNRALRERLYRAYVTRASEFSKAPATRCCETAGAGASAPALNQESSHADQARLPAPAFSEGAESGAQWDNTPLITQILKLRQEKARLLGYANYAEVSLARKMARSPREVLDFLRELGKEARPYAEPDFTELKQFARVEPKLEILEAWDIAYASEKLRAKRYSFSDQEVKQYFPELQVLQGLFQLVERLYGIRIEKTETPVWHPDVRFYNIFDFGGRPIGQFYVDLYSRPSKRGGAWMDEAIARRRKDGAIQIPVAYLNCNFSAPVGGRPALFTHDEVITLFHEFGHGLHHLLTSVEELGVSGINGVEWDAVELPSQFMENFCWEWDVLKYLTRHVDSGEPLPRALYEKMLAAKNFQSGMQTVRQLELALFDMHLHYDFDPHGGKTPLQLLDEIRREIAVVFPPHYNRLPNNFSHIFAGGYAAGYYSYKWAEVLSADAYSLFEENGVVNQNIGRRFWQEILSVGGSRPALESFVAFRGRAPKIDALLRHNGMTHSSANQSVLKS
ncbi:MAG TPA: M3 family metallopeptidase [Burkholderiales bacterium]|nr:M3 family metallopeptidase [Burkholderiales bacterium]